MNGQVDTGALEEFLRGKGLLGKPVEKKLYDYDAAIKAGQTPEEGEHWTSRVGSGEDEGLILKDLKHPTFYKTVAAEEELGNKFYEEAGRLFSFHPSDPILQDPNRNLKLRPLPVTVKGKPKTSYVNLLARFLQNKGLDIKAPEVPTEELTRPLPVTDPRAPTREQVAAGLPLLTPGPEIPTLERRPQELIDRPADYVPPPAWWQQVKDVGFLLKNGNINAASIVARGLLENLALGNVDPIKMVEKISGVEGFAAEYDAEVSRKFQERAGYTPTAAVKVPRIAGQVVGALVPLGVIFKGAGVAARAATKIPALQALARAELGGIAVGLAAKPEDEGVLNRLQQVPPSVLFFTAFEGLRLSAQQVLKIVRYNRAARVYKNVDWNAIPDIPGEEPYTAKQMRDLFVKFTGNVDPATKLPKGITPEETKILNFFKDTGGWREAVKEGWMPPAGFRSGRPIPETGIPAAMPRRPRFSDIFRRPPFAPFEPRPGAPPPAEPPTVPPEAPPVRPAAVVRPEAPPPTERPLERLRGREGAPAVIVDVEPKPEGGWTYNFKIPTPEAAAPIKPKMIEWRPEAAKKPKVTVIPPGEEPIVTPAPAKKKLTPEELKAQLKADRRAGIKVVLPKAPARKWRNPLWQAFSNEGGIRPAPKGRKYDYDWLKQYVPFNLINNFPETPMMDDMASNLTAEFPQLDGEERNLADMIVRMQETRRDAAAVFRRDPNAVDPGDPLEYIPPQEFFTEELDDFILDEISAGRGDDLDPASRERAKELIDLVPPEQAEKFGLDEGMAKAKEIMRKRREKADKEMFEKIVAKDIEAAPRLPEEEVEELKLEREEEVKPKKPAPKKKEPTLIKKEEPVKPKGKYPEGFNDLGWKSIPQYQGTLTEARKTAAAGFDVEYGPVEKGDKGYVRITATRPGKKGKVIQKSLTSIPKDLKTPAEQLGIDDEVSGDLFAKAAPGVKEADLVEALDELRIPDEHRGEVSISVLKTFDPKKGDLKNYIRKTIANISKRKGPEKQAKLKEKKRVEAEEISREAAPSARLAEAQAEVDILEAIERTTKNKKEVEIMRRRILDEDSFEEIGKTMKISRQRAQKVFADTIVKMKKDPAVIRMLEDRYKEVHAGPKPKWKDITKIASTYFTSSKGMSKQIDAANDKRIQGPIADLFLTTLEGKEVARWIQKNDNAGLRQQVKELLTGEASFDNIALPENVPEEALKSLRKRIDDLSTLIMAHGGLKEETLAAFESGIGKYLGTFYRLHEYNELNKGRLVKQYWDPPQEARDRFAAALRRDDPAGFADFTDEMMDNFLDSMLRGEDYVYRRSNRTKRVPTEHYKSQVGVSKEYEEFAGIITDPVWLALRTVTKQTVMGNNAQFLNTLEDNPETARMITRDLKTARSRGWQGNQLPDDYSYGRLRGAWVHPELNKFIRGEINPQMSSTERMIMKFVMNPFKATKTIWSVPTHARNVTGGVMFSFLMQTSIFNPLNAPYYWETLRIWQGRKGKMRDEWAEFIRRGVTETQFFKSEIPDLYNELLRLDPPDWPEKIFSWAVRRPANALGELYNFEDVLYRGAAYLKHIKHFKKTPQEAVDVINLGSPNYRKVPIAVEWLRRYPALGPFISFRFNVARILSNQAIQAGKEISSKDPKKKIEGWLRIYRLAFIIGFPLLLAKISAKVFDVDEKKVKELEKTYPSYKRGGTIVYFRGEEGQLKGYDFTYTYPTGDIVKAINNLMGGDTDSFSEDVQLFAHPIFDAYSIIVKGEDPYWRTPIKDPLERRATELVKLLWLPQSAPIPSIKGLVEGIKTGKIGENLRVGKITTYQIENLIQAYQKQEDRYGRVRKLPEELKNFFTGVRTWDINPDVLIAQYIKQKKFAIEDAEKAYERWLKRNTKAAYWQIEEEEALLERKRDKITADIERVGKLLEEMDPTFHLRKSGRFK